jgi:glycosyltransferase involved in cell wall biosynthesis
VCANKNPKLSVVLPAFNAEKTLRRAIDSILNQTFPNFELIVIDDGSTDGTCEVVESYKDIRIRLVRFQENQGLIAGLNKGLEIARGEYVARQDADDESVTERFAKQVAILESNSHIGVVGSCVRLRDSSNKLLGIYSYPSEPDLARWQSLFKTPVAHSTAVFRRSVVESVGGYNEKYKLAEDYELWTRVSAVAQILSLRDKLVYYNVRDGGVSVRNRKAQDDMHMRIASENMRAMVGREIDQSVVRALTISVDRSEEGVDHDVVRKSIDLLFELRSGYHGTETKKNIFYSVEMDVIRRAAALIKKMSYQERVSGISDVLSRGRFGVVSTLMLVSSVIR